MLSRHTRVVRGSALIAGLALACGLTATAPAVAAEQARLTAPTLTGQYDVGTIDLHLVDPSRPDPWKPERRRELMVTVTYPADRFAKGPRAPWLTPGMSTVIDQALAGEDYLDLPAGSIDWASAKRRAETGVSVAHGAPKPVALFSPGFGVPRETYSAIVDDLASRGYVVVSLSHTYESVAVEFPGGRLELAVSEGEGPEFENKALDARVADSRFVLDQLTKITRGENPDTGKRPLPRGLGRSLDLSRVGAYGHSSGGFTAGETMVHDRRVDAGINLDGAMATAVGYPPGSPYVPGEVTKRGLDRPFLLMGAEGVDENGKPLEHTHRHPEFDRSWADFWASQKGWKRDLLLRGGSTHMAYSDLQIIVPQLGARVAPEKREAVIGTIDPRRSLAAQRDYIGAFFDLHLRGRDLHLFDGESPRHPNIDFID
ncbi:platelet-activating factor acetylhydrolase isoform II [Nonomuraea polychroma]|uniref:Platelet-activating factor acetylhydrolase isoform II n=1 Tax=Nonomuraea polychroma TaxID=46176 RepID=A0A438M5K0_9ACTN|nr:lipase [Nonomuraea polychroma]RVX41085.1 platelet-activating factor acetylhydrolase isoform II [Nonomuraea polychroma]